MTKKEELRIALEKVYKKLIAHEKNIKVWEMEYQKAIDTVFPSECWWKVTNCEIFMHLMLNHNPLSTLEQILKEYRFKEEV